MDENIIVSPISKETHLTGYMKMREFVREFLVN
jgi:hypothetical protein